MADTAPSRTQVAETVAAAARAVAGVADLSPGPELPPVSTLAPGGAIVGVRLGEDRVHVHVVADRVPLPPLLEDVRRQVTEALRALGDERGVFVRIEDIVLDDGPDGPDEPDEPGPGPGTAEGA